LEKRTGLKENSMKIAIEAMGIHNFGGGRSSIFNLLQNLFAIDHENEYLVVLSKPEPELAPPAARVQQWIAPTTNRFAARLWAQAAFPIRFRGYDLAHFTKNLGVWGLPVPYVVTIHDLTILAYPQFFPKSDLLYWKTLEKWTIRSAARVISVSQCTTRDLQTYYGTPPDKIRIIYHGKAPSFYPRPPAEIETVRQRYHLPENYLITVGRIDIKKNLSTLVVAFDLVKRAGYTGKLVLVGEVYKKCEDKALLPTIQRLGLEQDVLLVGRIPDNDLPAMYCGATACVFASRHEGFGLVALEAMACGTPVITHNASAVIEVIGDAGICVDASLPQALAGAVQIVLDDPVLRQELRRRGLMQSQQFSWESAARQTLAAYQETANNKPAAQVIP
jgi:glycosyltransferase involved in cell wall biosynthesis